MNFVQFAQANDVLIRTLDDDGRIHRCGTANHPKSRSGAYKFSGDWGWCQAWDVSEEPAIWFSENTTVERRETIKRDLRADMLAEQKRREAAANDAAEIVKQCRVGNHLYLDKKGFADVAGLIDFDGRLVIPMRDVNDYKRINSLQFINREGEKKFMTGGKAKGSIHKIGSGVELWLCEGFATGLSVRAALKSLYRDATVVVCFSASNVAYVASQLQGKRYIVADNDSSKTGEKFAAQTGLPFIMPPDLDTDANDYHQSAGVFALARLLRSVL